MLATEAAAPPRTLRDAFGAGGALPLSASCAEPASVPAVAAAAQSQALSSAPALASSDITLAESSQSEVLDTPMPPPAFSGSTMLEGTPSPSGPAACKDSPDVPITTE